MLILLMAGLPPVLADENENTKEYVNETKQSSIRGRIVDKSGQTLPGATIFIESLHTGAISDINGFYTLANLPVGTYKIKISYVGYSPVELTITVPEGKTVERDVTLSEGIELQEVVVGGTFQGQRRALASQKNAMGISNVVSADQVGKFPDSNIGDALKRISGINVQYDQGEARFGQVRGTSADLSSVTINGNRIPSAEGALPPHLQRHGRKRLQCRQQEGTAEPGTDLRRPLPERQAGTDDIRLLPICPRRLGQHGI